MAEDARSNTKVNNECLTFVDVHGQLSCNIDQIQSLITSADLSKKPFTYHFDKHYEFSFKQESSNKVVVILYSQIGTKQFHEFHQKILSLALPKANYQIDYILRHNYKPSTEDSKK